VFLEYEVMFGECFVDVVAVVVVGLLFGGVCCRLR
jgi:hypothetical protein